MKSLQILPIETGLLSKKMHANRPRLSILKVFLSFHRKETKKRSAERCVLYMCVFKLRNENQFNCWDIANHNERKTFDGSVAVEGFASDCWESADTRAPGCRWAEWGSCGPRRLRTKSCRLPGAGASPMGLAPGWATFPGSSSRCYSIRKTCWGNRKILGWSMIAWTAPPVTNGGAATKVTTRSRRDRLETFAQAKMTAPSRKCCRKVADRSMAMGNVRNHSTASAPLRSCTSSADSLPQSLYHSTSNLIRLGQRG